jgi:anti-sigma factor RsiW
VTCRELADFIADYLSGDLPAGTREGFEHHLSICENCQTYLANYRRAVALGQRAFADDSANVPDDVPDELVNAILQLRRR